MNHTDSNQKCGVGSQKIEGSGFESCRPLVVKLFLSTWGDTQAWFHWLPAHRAPPGMLPAYWKNNRLEKSDSNIHQKWLIHKKKISIWEGNEFFNNFYLWSDFGPSFRLIQLWRTDNNKFFKCWKHTIIQTVDLRLFICYEININ